MLGSRGNSEDNMCSEKMWKLTVYFFSHVSVTSTLLSLFRFICYPANDPIRELNCSPASSWMADGFSLRPQKCLGTAVWVPEGWAITWEVILLEKHIPLCWNALLSRLCGTASLMCPWPCHVCIWSKAHSLEEKGLWVMWFGAYLASFITIKACVITAGRSTGVGQGYFLSLTKDLKYFKSTPKL